MENNAEHQALTTESATASMLATTATTVIETTMTIGTGKPEIDRHLFNSVKNETERVLRASSAHLWSSNETLPILNQTTEASVVNLWKLATSNGSSVDTGFTFAHVQNQSHINDLFDIDSVIGSIESNTTSSTAGISVSSNSSTIFAYNNSFEVQDIVTTWDVWMGKPFPSGYTQLAIVLLAFFLACIMILVVVGNMLVCIAIATEKSLKPVQNWFIASLAVSDFFIGLIIMPFSLARELMGYWMFGQVWCDIHAALDVLLCTASINSLFLISLDRYWSITQAVKYLKKRTPSRAAFMIAFVWIFSALVSLPPLVGWKKAEQSSEYPQCNLSEDIGYVLYSSIGSFYFPALMMVFVYARIFIAARSRARKHIEKKRLKMMPEPTPADGLKEKSTTTTICTSFSNQSPPENLGKETNASADCLQAGDSLTPLTLSAKTTTTTATTTTVAVIQVNIYPSAENAISGDLVKQVNSKLPLTKSPPPQIIIEPSPESRRQSWNIISTSELISSINIGGDQMANASYAANELPGSAGRENANANTNISSNNGHSVNSTCENSDGETTEVNGEKGDSNSGGGQRSGSKVYFPRLKSVSRKAFQFRKPRLNGLSKKGSVTKTVTIEDDSDTADSPTSKEQPSFESKAFLSAPAKLIRSKFGSSLSIVDYEDSDLMEDDKKSTGRSSGGSGKGRVQYHDPPVVGIHVTSDAERHKRKIAKARERRATLIVGLIMAAFITAWLPFFMLYVLAALCVTCKENIPEGVFAVAFWLGYCNSAANPIIYTIFNRDYRKAFRKILFK